MKAVHFKEKDIKCAECGNSFSRRSGLVKHVKAIHFKLKPIKPFQCNICELRFAKESTLLMHRVKKHSQEQF